MRRERMAHVAEVDVGTAAGVIVGDCAVDEDVAREERDELEAQLAGARDGRPEAAVEPSLHASCLARIAVSLSIQVAAVEADGEAGEDVGVGGDDDEERFEGDALVVC